jgi:hypothetical protein
MPAKQSNGYGALKIMPLEKRKIKRKEKKEKKKGEKKEKGWKRARPSSAYFFFPM